MRITNRVYSKGEEYMGFGETLVLKGNIHHLINITENKEPVKLNSLG